VAERAGLHPIAVNFERVPRERAPDEAWDDHPVLPLLSRADGVEEAGNHAIEVALLMETQREELVHGL